jgi:hemerythrin superfamily protein
MPTDTDIIDVDIIEVLERDHRRISDLAERLDSVTDPEEIRALYRQIVDGLLAHEAIEQDVLFPAFRELLASSGPTPLDERMGEHDELNSLLAEMRDLDADGFAFMKRGSALLLEIERHFESEEESVFAPMRERLPKETLLELGRRALAAQTSPD